MNEARITVISEVLDALVAALGGDPSCTLRRALILLDIDEYSGTTQSDIAERLSVHKSALNRDVQWLYDNGCIRREKISGDARQTGLYICGYAKKNLDLALDRFYRSHQNLRDFLLAFVALFGRHRPTLRDAKIVATLSGRKTATRRQIFDSLYEGPLTTNNRALGTLVDFGFVEKQDDGQEHDL